MSRKIRLADGRVVGVVEGRVFKKRVRGSAHFLRTPLAIALDVETLGQAEDYGADSVEILDLETGRLFRASVATIRERGFRVDRRFGEQVALPLDRWEVRGPGVARQLGLPIEKVAAGTATRTEAKETNQQGRLDFHYNPKVRP